MSCKDMVCSTTYISSPRIKSGIKFGVRSEFFWAIADQIVKWRSTERSILLMQLFVVCANLSRGDFFLFFFTRILACSLLLIINLKPFIYSVLSCHHVQLLFI